MPIEIKMPALSPTMEEGTLAKWLVKVGDTVAPGDVMAEIETDKATMEYEAVDEGTITAISVPAGTAGVKVGTVIATLSGDDAAAGAGPPDTSAAADRARAAPPISAPPVSAPPVSAPPVSAPAAPAPASAAPASPRTAAPLPAPAAGSRIAASPLARRLAESRGIDLATLKGSGPNGRIVRADIDAVGVGAPHAAAAAPGPVASTGPAPAPAPASNTAALLDDRVPHSIEKLSSMRKTIARRLAQSMQQAPHIYLTLDVRLDRLLALRGELNAALKRQGIKLSVNDMLIKALGKALMLVPECNVTFAGDEMIRYNRADIAVAVSIPGGLITPIVEDADGRSLSSIATAMKDLGQRAKEGKLQPGEYQGGTASISNMGMMGIKQFTAVINPPQSTILAIGAGEKRPWVMPDGTLGVAQAMTATGSFDHRAIDGADGARLMAAFRELVEAPLSLVA